MDKILIINGDAAYVQSLKLSLGKMRQFEVETASCAEDAIELLEKKKISVLVTEVVLPGMDVLDLLSHMSRTRPNTPCIVMTDHGKPWFKEQMAQQSFLYHIEKPFEIKKLASAIFVGLNLRDEGKNFKGMTLASVLPLLEILQRTCRLEVSSKKHGRGYLYFKNGMIIDAHYQKLSSEKAAQEMIEWDGIVIKLTDLPQCRKRSRVKTSLMDMAGACWTQDIDACVDKIELTPESIDSVLDSFCDEFHRIRGYQAFAVVTEDGQVMASDQIDKTARLSNLADDLTKFFGSENSSGLVRLENGEAVTLHKQKNVITFLKPEKETIPRIRLIGVTTAGGNWFYMKESLKKLLDKILIS